MVERISRALGSLKVKTAEVANDQIEHTRRYVSELLATYFEQNLSHNTKPISESITIQRQQGSSIAKLNGQAHYFHAENPQIGAWDIVCFRANGEKPRTISLSDNWPPADIDLTEDQCDCCRTKQPGQDGLLLRDRESGEYLRLVARCFVRKYSAKEFEALKSEFLVREYGYHVLAGIESETVFSRLAAGMIPERSMPPIFKTTEPDMSEDKETPIAQLSSRLKVLDVIAYLVAHFRLETYISKTKALSGNGKATAPEVFTRMLMDVQEIEYDQQYKPTPSDYQKAFEVKAQIEQQLTNAIDKDEFQLKVEQELSAPRINQTTIAILAAPVFKNLSGKSTASKKSGFLGAAGDRVEMPLKYTSSKPFYSKTQDKNFFRHNFVDEFNRSASWVTEAPAERYGLQPQKWTIAKFTIKATETFNDAEFTNISRVLTTGCFESKPQGAALNESKKEAKAIDAALNLYDSKKREKATQTLIQSKDFINSNEGLLNTIATDLFIRTLKTRRGEGAEEWIERMLKTGINLPKSMISVPARGQFEIPAKLSFAQACRRLEAHKLADKYTADESDPLEPHLNSQK